MPRNRNFAPLSGPSTRLGTLRHIKNLDRSGQVYRAVLTPDAPESCFISADLRLMPDITHHFRTEGWAACPITENGFVRVVCGPACPTVSPTPEEALERLAEFCTDRYHHFLADSVSLRNRGEGPGMPIRGGGQITDVYLLCLCRNAGASPAAFDSRLRNSSIGSGWRV